VGAAIYLKNFDTYILFQRSGYCNLHQSYSFVTVSFLLKYVISTKTVQGPPSLSFVHNFHSMNYVTIRMSCIQYVLRTSVIRSVIT
jgi:hypothetical protein